MKRNIIETVLGAVVLLIAAVFLIYASRSAQVGDVEGYNLKASFGQIGGLQKGADVRISGVKIGTVSDIEMNAETYHADLTLTLDDKVRVPADSVARVASESLLGGAYLAIDPGADEAMLKAGEALAFTQSPQSLEELLGKFIFSVKDAKDNADKKADPEAPASTEPQAEEQAIP